MSQTTLELDQARNYWRTVGIPADRLEVMDNATFDLIASGLRNSSLKAGDRVQDFILMDTHGTPVRLYNLLDQGAVVISFYRGGWCPYCNIELRGLERSLSQIQELGANVVAISPQLPDHSLSTGLENGLSYPVLSDVGNVVAKRFGIVFQLPPALLGAYKDFGHELAVMNGAAGASELPVPATFIVDSEGIIRSAFVEEDYTKRLDPEEIIRELKRISGRK